MEQQHLASQKHSTGEPVIVAEGVGKRYRLGQGAGIDQTLGEMVYAKASHWWGRVRGQSGEAPPQPGRRFDAIRDLSFDVRRGEVFGIIGRNGAGKSTLLKVLARITPPTVGEITIRGRIGSLLEVGTGFHPELTGRENIYLNGAILGMTRREIAQRFDEIVAFAEIERFLDTPVKRYSSGMYVRLAFAVAAHLEPEVLLIDEVLAVGDAGFQQKCIGKMDGIANSGRTILFVSHDMGAVTTLCDRVMLLDGGEIVLIDTPEVAVARYLELTSDWRDRSEAVFSGPLTGAVSFQDIQINGKPTHEVQVIRPETPVVLTVHGTANKRVHGFRTTVSLYKARERVLTIHDVATPQTLEPGPFTAQVRVPAKMLRPHTYQVAVGGYQDGTNHFLWATDLARFSVLENWSKDYDAMSLGLLNVAEPGIRTPGHVSPTDLEVVENACQPVVTAIHPNVPLPRSSVA